MEYLDTLSYVIILLKQCPVVLFFYIILPPFILVIDSILKFEINISFIITCLSNGYLNFLKDNLFLLIPIYILVLVIDYGCFDDWYLEKAKQFKKKYKLTIETYAIQRRLKDSGRYQMYSYVIILIVLVLLLFGKEIELTVMITAFMILTQASITVWKVYNENDKELDLIKKDYWCSGCGKEFSRHQALKKHQSICKYVACIEDRKESIVLLWEVYDIYKS